jgi:argininosuccinate synthase
MAQAKDTQVKKTVLAYSGGLDTSVILPWIKEHYGCKMVAYVGDVGQGKDELKGITQKAKRSGADKVVIADLKKTFVEDYIWKMLKSGAVYEHKYLLGTSIARPLIAAEQVRVAHEENADAVAHGATGKGNDQVRFELTFMALDPSLKIIAPWKDKRFELTSREAAVDYAAKRNIPVPVSKKSIYSRDRNIWHISHEGADLEDPWNEPKDELWVMSVPRSKAPEKATYVTIDFEAGVPVGVNGKKMDGVKLLTYLNDVGGKNAVGQTWLVENRQVGMKSRGAYETPGGTILVEAIKGIEALVLDRETMHFKQMLSVKYGELVYNGMWFAPLREALDTFFDRCMKYATGSVRVKLQKGNCEVAGAKSKYSLYSKDLASFTMGAEYDPSDAIGFIKLLGLPLTVQCAVQKQAGKKK